MSLPLDTWPTLRARGRETLGEPAREWYLLRHLASNCHWVHTTDCGWELRSTKCSVGWESRVSNAIIQCTGERGAKKNTLLEKSRRETVRNCWKMYSQREMKPKEHHTCYRFTATTHRRNKCKLSVGLAWTKSGVCLSFAFGHTMDPAQQSDSELHFYDRFVAASISSFCARERSFCHQNGSKMNPSELCSSVRWDLLPIITARLLVCFLARDIPTHKLSITSSNAI